MKKFISCLLIMSFFTCALSGCGDTTPESVVQTEREFRKTRPRHDFSDVVTTETFEDLYIEYDGIPWAEQHDLNYADGDITTDFAVFLFDSNDEELPGNPLHTYETISKPVVISYPSDREGYVVYEVDYSIILPLDTTAGSDYSYFDSYYRSVQFLDYYTGYQYPWLRMSADRLSYHISGNIIYNGETYQVDYYQFREDEDLSSSTVDTGDGQLELHQLHKINITAYFIVPRGYDGIVMYADISLDERTYAEHMEFHEQNFDEISGMKIFGEDRDQTYFDDYEFIPIVRPI